MNHHLNRIPAGLRYFADVPGVEARHLSEEAWKSVLTKRVEAINCRTDSAPTGGSALDHLIKAN